MERKITGADLMRMLSGVLEEITRHNTVYVVNVGKTTDYPLAIQGLVTPEGDVGFALGSSMFGNVFQLIDEEYGWPEHIDISEIRDVTDLMPGYRRHPVVCRNRECLAMSISIAEYNLLLESNNRATK
jgi:hypothetical protein